MVFRKVAQISTLLFAALLLQIVASPTAFAKLSQKDIEKIRKDLEAKHATFTVGRNSATERDLSQLCGLNPEKSWQSSATFREVQVLGDPPASFNWCDQGGCPSVKDQGSCGSCWAFGTVGALETNILIMDGVEEDLSEQYLVSCNTDDWGCDGGWWAHDYHQWKYNSPQTEAGAVPESEYPYTGTDSACVGVPLSHPWKIEDWSYIGDAYSVPSVEAIKQAIMDYGPVSAAVYAGPYFQGYTDGIFNVNEVGTVNHAIVLVGWDDSQGDGGVWILRNSWGPYWGEDGYMRIEYGTSQVGYSANYIVYAGQTPGFNISPAESDSIYVCLPDSLPVQLDIEPILGFSEPVTLSANNLPTGVTATFDPNPVTPLASSIMTVTVDASVAPGSYEFQVHGDGGGQTDDLDMTLFAADSVPVAPVLENPYDGHENGGYDNVYFSWLPVDGAKAYHLQVDDDPAFSSPEEDALSTDAFYVLAGVLTQGQTYYWRVSAISGCGEGLFSDFFSFVANQKSILLVDDDDNSPDVRPYYDSALNSSGYTYDTWDTNNSDIEPAAADLSGYSVVLWFTGSSFSDYAGPATETETVLGNYLDDGGSLFISSQDYHWVRGFTPFMQNYLGVASIADDTGNYRSVSGVNDFSPAGTYNLTYPFADYSDILFPGSGTVAFRGDNYNNAAVNTLNTVFFAFPWEAVANNISGELTSSEGDQLLDNVLSYLLGTGVSPCKCDLDNDSDCDGSDWFLFSQDWGVDCTNPRVTCACDLDADDDCDGSDWFLFSEDWGRSDCP